MGLPDILLSGRVDATLSVVSEVGRRVKGVMGRKIGTFQEMLYK